MDPPKNCGPIHRIRCRTTIFRNFAPIVGCFNSLHLILSLKARNILVIQSAPTNFLVTLFLLTGERKAMFWVISSNRPEKVMLDPVFA